MRRPIAEGDSRELAKLGGSHLKTSYPQAIFLRSVKPPPLLCGLQMKDKETEKQVEELTRSLEVLMREKKDLEVKERITRDALSGVLPHMDRLFAHKVCMPTAKHFLSCFS